MKILVIRAGALGDVVLTLPVLHILRAQFPKAHIEIMGYPTTLEWIRGQGYVDAVQSIEQSGMAGFFLRDGVLPEDLRTYFGAFDGILLYSQDQEGVFAENLRRTGAGQVGTWPAFPPEGERVHETHHLLKGMVGAGFKSALTDIEPEDRIPRIEFQTESP